MSLKLAGNCASSAPRRPAFGQRLDAGAELVDVGLRDLREQIEQRALGAGRALERRLAKHLRVRELLIQLQRELEARRRALDPVRA